MIFITLGSQKFQFNRLIKKIDELIEANIIKEDVFAQIGYSDYKPQYYKYKDFLDRNEFAEMMGKCRIVITHGGTGAIIGAVKNNKKVIAVPRLKRYSEHVDDHQIQIIKQFEGMNIISACYDINSLEKYIIEIDKFSMKKYVSNTERIILSIEEFLDEIV